MASMPQPTENPTQDILSHFAHRLAQPLATAALALEIAQMARQRGNTQEAENRIEVALQALRQAQSMLLERR